MDIKAILNAIGENVSLLTNKILTSFNESGIITSIFTAKLISILIILGISWVVLHIFSTMKTPVRVLIYIVSGLLIISIVMTFFSK